MELALKLHKCLTNGADSHKVLDLFNEIRNKDMLALIVEFFVDKYNMTLHEFIMEKYKPEELYAISSTLQYIREPNSANNKSRLKFYDKIGYSSPY